MRFFDSVIRALAHEHFAISSIPRGQDPFFDLDDEAKRLLSVARSIVQVSDDDEIINMAMEKTHKALFLSRLKTEAIFTLKFGVDAIMAAERGHAGKAVPCADTASFAEKELSCPKN